jgi:hypothetical protein
MLLTFLSIEFWVLELIWDLGIVVWNFSSYPIPSWVDGYGMAPFSLERLV